VKQTLLCTCFGNHHQQRSRSSFLLVRL